MHRIVSCGHFILMAWIAGSGATAADTNSWKPEIPRTWDESALADWATPLAGLNLRPTQISAKEYYSLPADNLRTYPVYFPDREPEGYWEMLQRIGPQPLIEPEKLKSKADWIEAGRQVFDQADHIQLRTLDPNWIAKARSRETYRRLQPLPDGTVYDLVWVPTKQGVALSFPDCSGCHRLYLPDGQRVPGAPVTARPNHSLAALIAPVQLEKRVVQASAPFLMGPEPFGMWLYQAWGVPWRKDDINNRLRTFTEADFTVHRAAFARSGGIPRWNGSLFYPAKVPDLIGIQDRKYIDHTATHLHRGIGDLMRYAAAVSFAEAADFGPYHMLGKDTRRVRARLPDEALYALALYIYSLKPPPNPNPFHDRARAGQKIFAREGCPMCHSPPLYTSNKLTLAQGFTPPKDAPASLDILPLCVGTDSGLALATRKGTGYYKVPSLKGLWYRGHYLHDGSAASLEEMFDPQRLRETHVPGGFIPAGMKTRAIVGHEFGLKLDATERGQLITFLRTL